MDIILLFSKAYIAFTILFFLFRLYGMTARRLTKRFARTFDGPGGKFDRLGIARLLSPTQFAGSETSANVAMLIKGIIADGKIENDELISFASRELLNFVLHQHKTLRSFERVAKISSAEVRHIIIYSSYLLQPERTGYEAIQKHLNLEAANIFGTMDFITPILLKDRLRRYSEEFSSGIIDRGKIKITVDDIKEAKKWPVSDAKKTDLFEYLDLLLAKNTTLTKTG